MKTFLLVAFAVACGLAVGGVLVGALAIKGIAYSAAVAPEAVMLAGIAFFVAVAFAPAVLAE